jgi:predicted GNAT family acetyltransferase
MTVEVVDDARVFLERAGPLLLADEPRHNLVLGITGTLIASPDRYGEKRFWIASDGGAIVAAALRTPPYNLVLAKPRDDDALATLALAIEDDLPGVSGARPEADAFARLWCEQRGGRATVLREMGVYALERVRPVPEAPGRSRPATRGDRALLVGWMDEFGREALDESDPGRTEARAAVEHRLGAEDGGFTLWEDGGEPVSVSGWGGPTPSGIRIGPVYTPPHLRGRGYATALVAELSATLLAQGRRFCFLFTDLANPTSNAIYERIGYARVCEATMISFSP